MLQVFIKDNQMYSQILSLSSNFNNTKEISQSNTVLANSIEIIKDKLFWYCNRFPPKNISDSFFFNIDEILVYNGYNKDFGPLSLAQVHRYCTELKRIMKDEKYKSMKIFHHCSPHFQKQSNACFLMGAFMIVCYGKTAEEAYHPFKHLQLVAFRDAGEEPCNYECTVLDCLRGLERAIGFSWYNYLKFDYKEYEFNHKLENGDMNWITPNKILAFSSPTDNPKNGLPPNEFIQSFKKMKITAIIRLNEQLYEEKVFEKHGIKVYDMEFTDGSCPEDHIMQTFISIVEAEHKLGGAIAVHCRAGLGRTGTLIAAHIMHKYNFEPRALIGWLRIARPGSVIGIQQQFLVDSFQRIRQLHIAQLSGKSLRTFNMFNNQTINHDAMPTPVPVHHQRFASAHRVSSNNGYIARLANSRFNQLQDNDSDEEKIQSKYSSTQMKYNAGKSCQGEQLIEKRKKKLTSYMSQLDKILSSDTKFNKGRY